MSTHRHIYPDLDTAAEACARHTRVLLDDVLAGQELATLAVSGGSSPKLLFAKLAAIPFRWDPVHLFWVDERCVPPHDPASNYKLADDYLIRPARIPHRQTHRIQGELPPDAAAKAYVQEIQDFFGLEGILACKTEQEA